MLALLALAAAAGAAPAPEAPGDEEALCLARLDAVCAAVCADEREHAAKGLCECDALAGPVRPDAELAAPPTADEEAGDASVEAFVDELCRSSLADVLEWQDDAEEVEIGESSLTLRGVPEDVYVYTVCHTLCSPSCGAGVVGEGLELEVDGCSREPASTFLDPANAVWSSGYGLQTNVFGRANGTDVSVRAILSAPVYSGTTRTSLFPNTFSNRRVTRSSSSPPAPDPDDAATLRRLRCLARPPPRPGPLAPPERAHDPVGTARRTARLARRSAPQDVPRDAEARWQ